MPPTFSHLEFELKILKTTGDKLQSADPAAAAALATRALFTKELETALLQRRADLAVHSLKDLPTDLPDGLKLAAVAGMRADVRDVLVYRINNGFAPRMKLSDFPPGLTVATGSARRQTQLLAIRPDFLTVADSRQRPDPSGKTGRVHRPPRHHSRRRRPETPGHSHFLLRPAPHPRRRRAP